MLEQNGMKRRHFSFKLIFLLLRTNDRLGGAGATPQYDSRVFLEFHYVKYVFFIFFSFYLIFTINRLHKYQ